ncbi:TPA: RHS repeat protein [Pseudomonas aeruginosa]|nr:RHS repeat protein [Pseudomonas aeruginosa]HDQ4748183.1 RHS repeat protein [Pseudomonas aeruginosa]
MLKLKEHPITTISILFLITQHNLAFSSDSEIFCWTTAGGPGDPSKCTTSPIPHCEKAVQKKQDNAPLGYKYQYIYTEVYPAGSVLYSKCHYTETVPTGQVFTNQYLPGPVLYNLSSCQHPNFINGSCLVGVPPKTDSCASPSFYNIYTGEPDYTYTVPADPRSPPISVNYDGKSNLWRHNFSDFLINIQGNTYISLSDGRTEAFPSLQKHPETLTKTETGYIYDSIENNRLEFDKNGKLINKKINEVEYSVTQLENNKLKISSKTKLTTTITQDTRLQPLLIDSETNKIKFTYDNFLNLRKIENHTSFTTFDYAPTSPKGKLSSVTARDNIKEALWTYRNNYLFETERASGTDKTQISDLTNDSMTIVNPYGRKTTYHFQFIQGIKYITSIDGEPSPNCPSSNSTFTYDDQGLLTSKRDNNGNLTTYQYNARGLETSRTEAAGTAQARTITTDWHPTLFLPVQVSEPGRITRYQYDAEGRKTGETVTTR